MTHPLPRRPNCEHAKQGVCRCRCIGTGHGLARLHDVRSADSRAALVGKRDPYFHEHKRLRQQRELVIADVERERARLLKERTNTPPAQWAKLPKLVPAVTQEDRRILHELALADLAIYLYDHRRDAAPPDTSASLNNVGAAEHPAPHHARPFLNEAAARHQPTRTHESAADVLANVETIAEIFSADVPDLLHEHLGTTNSERERGRKALSATHFWCSLLVGLVKALDFLAGPWDEISGKAREFVIDYLWERMPRRGRRGILEWLQRQLLTMLVNVAWKVVERAATAGLSLPEFHQALRVLGVISCPDLDVHPDVVECCLVPLIKEFADTDVRQYIIDELCVAYPALEDALRRYALLTAAN